MKHRLQDSDNDFVEFNPKAGTTKWRMSGASMRDFLVSVDFSLPGLIAKIIMDAKIYNDGSRITDLIDIDQQRQLWKRLISFGFKPVNNEDYEELDQAYEEHLNDKVNEGC
jgi:hypothetical protein